MQQLARLEHLLKHGKISRRSFIAKVSALGLLGAVSPAFLAGGAKAAAPKKGGTLRIGAQGATTDSLDPATMNDTIPISMNWSLRNCLVEVDFKGEAVPELAESWESTPDAANWTFKLRKGVEFHNGKPLEVQDVIYSIQHHRGEKSKSAVKGILEQIKEIKTEDKHTVTFMLESGNADFPYIMSDYHLAIFPDGTTVADLEKGIGTGGYTLGNHEPGVRAALKRNPNYWKSDRAHFDALQYTVINDVNARTNALKTKQIDVMNRCDLKTVHLLGRMPGLKVNNVQGYRHFVIPMQCDRAPYDDNDVRMALKLAIDREDMVKRILRGYGAVGNDIPIATSQKYFAADIPQRNYDPEKASYHIKKAGKQDHVFNLHTSGAAFAGANDAAVLYKEHAKKAGIKINVVQEPADGYWSNVWMKKEWIMSYWSGRATVDWMFSTAYSKESNWNETNWYNDAFNKLLKQARAELDQNKRQQMYFDMQQLVCNDGGAVIPMFSNWVEAVNDKVQIDDPAGNWELDGLRCTERWWFA